MSRSTSSSAVRGGEQRVPAFWAGDDTWKVRYAPEQPGRYTFPHRIE